MITCLDCIFFEKCSPFEKLTDNYIDTCVCFTSIEDDFWNGSDEWKEMSFYKYDDNGLFYKSDYDEDLIW